MGTIIDLHLNLLKEHFRSNISPADKKLIIEYRDKLTYLLTTFIITKDRDRSLLEQRIKERFEKEFGVS